MLVLLDIECQMLTIYKENGMSKIPLSQAHLLKNYTDSRNFLYVLDAVEMNSDEFLSMLNGEQLNDINNVQDDGIKYIHATGLSNIYISENLKFEGKFDIHEIDEEMSDILKNDNLIQKLLRSKKLEIINGIEKNKLNQEEIKINLEKIEKKNKSNEKMYEMIKRKISGDNEEDDHSDAISIDLDSGGRVGAGGGIGPTFNTMSELLKDIDGTE